MTPGVVLLVLAIFGPILLVFLSQFEGKIVRLITPLIFSMLILLIWQIICQGFNIPSILLPSPLAVVKAIILNLVILKEDFTQTVLRSVVPGWLIGCGAGFAVAILLDHSKFLRRGVLPLASAVSAMPIVGIAPILVMWFGFDWQSKAAMVVVITFFPMVINTIAGLDSTGEMERNLMTTYNASYIQEMIKLRIPNALPFIFTALKMNASLALIGAIIAEFFGTPIVGIGFRISTQVARMKLDVVWAEISLAAFAGLMSFGALALIERKVAFWHPSGRV